MAAFGPPQLGVAGNIRASDEVANAATACSMSTTFSGPPVNVATTIDPAGVGGAAHRWAGICALLHHFGDYAGGCGRGGPV